MSFNKLRVANVKRCEEVFHKLNSWSPTDWACAMAGEAGEACNAVKKLRRLADGTNTAKDPQTEAEAIADIAKELADTVIYADLLAARLNIDLGGAIRDKFNEVSRRMDSSVVLYDDFCPHCNPCRLGEKLTAAEARIKELEHGEYICKKCGLRKDADAEKGDF